MTGWGDIPLAVSAMKEGASEFFTKLDHSLRSAGALKPCDTRNIAPVVGSLEEADDPE
jgi:FixJ family two-component response regulator